MQVSRAASKEEFGNLRLDAVKHPITDYKFDELIEQLNITNINEDEKELFHSIIQDRKVSKEEFDKLSYEQVSKLNQLLNRSDMNGNYIPDTFVMFESLQMAPYLATPNISDDENYNKAVFNILKQLNLSQEEAISFVNEIGGRIDNEEKRDFENKLSSQQYDSGVRFKTYIGEDMQEYLSKRMSELKQGLGTSQDKTAIKDYEKLLDIYTSIDLEYNTLKSQNQAPLEQYTRNTRPNLLYNEEVINLHKNVQQEHDNEEKVEFEELLKTLGITNLNEEEKEKFRKILEDDELSNIEMDSLSYEQMKKVSQLILQEDEHGNFIEQTAIRVSSKTATLLSITNATSDEQFNIALYNKIKQMDDIQKINEFLQPLMYQINEKLKEYDFMVKLDMNKVIDELVERLQGYHDESEYAVVKEHYKNAIAEYKDFRKYYNSLTKED